MKMGRVLFAALAGALFAGWFGPASAQQTIRIGELNSYKAQPAFLEPYKKGLDLGVEEVNAAGGVLGGKLACKPFDTKGDPADATAAANQMMASASPVMVIGASPNAFVVPAQSDIKTMPELIAKAKANPGKLNWTSPGAGDRKSVV